VSDATGIAAAWAKFRLFRHWGDIPYGNTNEFRISAPQLAVNCAPSDEPIAWTEFSDIRPRLFHDTSSIHAGDEWKRHARTCAEASACFRVGWIHTRIADADQYFTILWLGDRHVLQVHNVWLTVAVENHCTHM
jgi:hypothetical protein